MILHKEHRSEVCDRVGDGMAILGPVPGVQWRISLVHQLENNVHCQLAYVLSIVLLQYNHYYSFMICGHVGTDTGCSGWAPGWTHFLLHWIYSCDISNFMILHMDVHYHHTNGTYISQTNIHITLNKFSKKTFSQIWIWIIENSWKY